MSTTNATNAQFTAQQSATAAATAATRRKRPQTKAEPQPPVTGESVDISDAAKSGRAAKVESSSPEAVRARLNAYFKKDEAYDAAMYKKMGVETKRDNDGFLEIEEQSVGMQLAFGLISGDTSFLDKFSKGYDEAVAHMQGVKPPPELKDYHAHVIEASASAGETFKTIKPMLELIGAMVSSGGTLTPEQEKYFEGALAKMAEFGDDPEKAMNSAMERMQNQVETLKAERKGICEQYGLNPGKWD